MAKSRAKAGGTSLARKPRKSAPRLLSGGNPQIAKADGDAPVQAYIAAMPGWKREAGRRLDALIVRAVPRVRKAVKWNSPFYGIEASSGSTLTHYLKVAFRGIAEAGSAWCQQDPDTRTRHYEDDGSTKRSMYLVSRRFARLMPCARRAARPLGRGVELRHPVALPAHHTT